jgi:hypothetical protein
VARQAGRQACIQLDSQAGSQMGRTYVQNNANIRVIIHVTQVLKYLLIIGISDLLFLNV